MPSVALSYGRLCGPHPSLPRPTGRVPAIGPCRTFVTECLLVGRIRKTKGPGQHWELDTMLLL